MGLLGVRNQGSEYPLPLRPLLLSWLQPLIAHVAATGDEACGAHGALDVRGRQLEDGACLRDDVLLDHGRAEIVAAEAPPDLADRGPLRDPRHLHVREIV